MSIRFLLKSKGRFSTGPHGIGKNGETWAYEKALNDHPTKWQDAITDEYLQRECVLGTSNATTGQESFVLERMLIGHIDIYKAV